jgi:hypothetical protein
MTHTREIWRQRWLGLINELTSIELQRKSWLDRKQSNPHWSFVEFMCSYFDDLLCGLPYTHYVEIGWISTQEYEVLIDWHETLDRYQEPRNDDHDREAILADKNWLEIVKTGEKAKLKLANSLAHAERKILTENIDYLQYK